MSSKLAFGGLRQLPLQAGLPLSTGRLQEGFSSQFSPVPSVLREQFSRSPWQCSARVHPREAGMLAAGQRAEVPSAWEDESKEKATVDEKEPWRKNYSVVCGAARAKKGIWRHLLELSSSSTVHCSSLL